MKPVFTWRQLVPISITLMAMLCGFFSILVTMESRGLPLGEGGAYHRWAALLIMLAMILDGMDGNVARRLKGCSEMGAELDTYVDMTAFGIAPAVLIYTVMLAGHDAMSASRTFWRVAMTAAVVLSGVVRLARFKAHDPNRGQAGYTGLPITACAGWVAMLVFVSQSKPFERFSLSQGPVAMLFLLGVLSFIILQVSNVRYPKPTKHPALFIPMVIMVCVLFGPQKVAVPAAVFMVVMVLSYIVFGPLYMSRALRRASASGDAQEKSGADSAH